MLGPDHQRYRAVRGVRQRDAPFGDLDDATAGFTREEVGLADEAGDEAVGRAVVKLARRCDLLDVAAAHDRDAVRHGQRFFLVMGDEDEGEPRLALQALQLDLHVLAQLHVECRKRLVEKQDARLGDEGAGERHALLLAAGKFRTLAVLEMQKLHQRQHLLDSRVDFRFRPALRFQREGHVLADRHVREERIALEHGVHRPLVWRHRGNVLAIEHQRAAARAGKARNQPEQRGLATAGRAEKGEELALGDRE